MSLWPSWYNPFRRALTGDVIQHAARLSGYSIAEIIGKGRPAKLSLVRQGAYLVAREQGHSSTQIGARFNRDHSTILHGCERARYQEGWDASFAEYLRTLRLAAETERPFVQPMPITFGEPARPAPKIPHIKAITLAEGEEADNGHKFHAGIAKGSAALLKALAA